MKTITKLEIEIYDIKLNDSEFNLFMSKINSLMNQGSGGAITLAYDNDERLPYVNDDDIPF